MIRPSPRPNTFDLPSFQHQAFSYDTHERHARRIEMARQTAKKQGCVIGILADLQGPKIRVSSFKQGKIELKKGRHISVEEVRRQLQKMGEIVGLATVAFCRSLKIF